ncbi:MAG: type II secretion system F family protein [Candidatus Omnitrophota bacterium]
MQVYEYKARDKFAKPITGLMSAEEESAVAVKLQAMGYTPVSIKQAQLSSGSSGILDRFRRSSASDVNMFTNQLAALQGAGVPVLMGLRTLATEVSSKNLRDTIAQVARDIEAGSTLSSALAKYPHIFSSMYVAAIKTAEASGTLNDALERLAALGEYDEKIRLRIKTATRYPIFVVIAIIIGFFVLTALVVPRFAKIYSQFTTALPLPTQILLGIHYAITHYWWFIVIFVILFSFGFTRFLNTKKGRQLWDALKLKTPIFGPLILKLAMARFARISGTLLKTGVSLFEVLDLTAAGVGNVVIAKTIGEIKKGVSEGKGFSEPMRESGVFPSIVVQMVYIGEQSGRLDDLLLHVADYYDSQVYYTVDNLTSLIEPLLIFVLGCAVLFMALAIFLPMWSLMNLFKA